MLKAIDINKIDPSPFQVRKYFNQVKQKELGASIQREGLIQPIVVRLKGRLYEIIAGERRFRAIRDFTDWKTIPAQIIKVSDIEARRISAAENVQREDLSAIETIVGIVELVDAELIKDKEYASMGKKSAERVKTLLRKLDSVRASKERGSKVSKPAIELFGKFAEQLKNVFKNLPKPLEWRTFYRHELPLLLDISNEVRKLAIQKGLSRAQIMALEALRSASPEEYQEITANSKGSSRSVVELGKKESAQIELKDLSGREIRGIAEKAVKKEMLAELKRSRVSPPSSHETGILMMSRLCIPVEKIATKLRVNRKTAKKYSENPRLIQSIKKSHKKGKPCHKIAEEFDCPEPLVWSITLEGKSDHERFKALGWGLRTWDQWFFNDLDRRFGDDWPGQIPAQLVGHTLSFFRQDKRDKQETKLRENLVKPIKKSSRRRLSSYFSLCSCKCSYS